jgi:hypothetical protein
MPFDPDFPFAPAGAVGIDDWFVPRQTANATRQPNDRIVPWSAQTDASFPDDWIYPDNRNPPTLTAAPSAPSPQPNALNPAISNRPTSPPDPFAAYWALIPASRVGAMAWHPPIFPSSNPFSPENIPASAWVTPLPIFLNSPGQFPSIGNAPPKIRGTPAQTACSAA